MWTHGHFYWNELMTRDVAVAKAFYAETLGWVTTEVPMPEGTYNLVMDGEKPVCGMMQMDGPDYEGMPDHWVGYIAVDNIDARVERARQNGATITQEPFDVEGVGRICMLQEPSGAQIGWMTPTDPQA